MPTQIVVALVLLGAGIVVAVVGGLVMSAANRTLGHALTAMRHDLARHAGRVLDVGTWIVLLAGLLAVGAAVLAIAWGITQ